MLLSITMRMLTVKTVMRRPMKRARELEPQMAMLTRATLVMKILKMNLKLILVLVKQVMVS